jgi:hypothetical protein
MLYIKRHITALTCMGPTKYHVTTSTHVLHNELLHLDHSHCLPHYVRNANNGWSIIVSDRVPVTAAQRGFSTGPKGPIVPGCEPGLKFRD